MKFNVNWEKYKPNYYVWQKILTSSIYRKNLNLAISKTKKGDHIKDDKLPNQLFCLTIASTGDKNHRLRDEGIWPTM